MAVTLQQEDDATFTKRIMPELERVEDMRRGKAHEAARRMKIAVGSGLAIAAASIGLYFFLGGGEGDPRIFFGIPLLAAVGLGWWQDQPRQQYEREYKSKVMPMVARLLGLSSYSSGGGLTVAEMQPSKILPQHTTCKTEDYFEGNYKGARLRFCELRLEKTVQRGKTSETIVVFNGLAVMIKLPKQKFYGQTVLVRDADGLAEWIAEKSMDLKRANLVDPVFEKKFTVYTNDQVEARYLIDPAMMERIQKISEVYAAKNMSMSYYGDSQILSLVDCTRNHFEPPGIYVPSTNIDAVMNIKHELSALLNFIDFLEFYRPVEPHQPTHGANP
ncbi:MAG: DUF3137 domain-containing protein [Alphaproteobacteria bacterium]